MEKLKKQRNEKNRKQYKEARNKYFRIRREEEKQLEKDVVKKCEEDLKLFYRYINGKMINRETIDKIVKGERIYQTVEEMSEIMNEFQVCVQCGNGFYRTKMRWCGKGLTGSLGAKT